MRVSADGVCLRLLTLRTALPLNCSRNYIPEVERKFHPLISLIVPILPTFIGDKKNPRYNLPAECATSSSYTTCSVIDFIHIPVGEREQARLRLDACPKKDK
jgi:hypothetical protein